MSNQRKRDVGWVGMYQKQDWMLPFEDLSYRLGYEYVKVFDKLIDEHRASFRVVEKYFKSGSYALE